MVIITAGMIGVGKTTLTGMLAEHLGTKHSSNQWVKTQYCRYTIRIRNNTDFCYKSIS